VEEGSHTHKNISIEPSLLFFTQFLAFFNILSYLCPQNRKVMITQTAGYKEAMDDIKHGRVTEYASLKDFYKEMGL
jgi:hypothetical protein